MPASVIQARASACVAIQIEAMNASAAIASSNQPMSAPRERSTGTAAELITHYDAHPPRGEIVLLIGPPTEQIPDADHADTLLLEALMTEKPSKAAAIVAKATGLDRKQLYARALELKAS